MRKALIAAVLLCSFMSLPALASEVTRGQALSAMVTTLDLPLQEGKVFQDVNPSTREGSIIQSAAVTGLIPASNFFMPETPLSNAESIAFAFQLMGWTHEAQLVGWLMPSNSDSVPQNYLSYLSLAQVVTPGVPRQLLEKPAALTNTDDLKILLGWLRQARFDLRWDQKFESHEGILWLHREGVGQPPSGWYVSLASFSDYNNAWDFSQKMSTRGALEVISRDDFYHVVTSKVPTAPMASLLSRSYPGSTVIPVEDDSQGALFWCAWSPHKPTDGSIVTASQLGSSSLPLSRFAHHTGATAAINGGFFSGNKPIGTLVDNAIPLSDTHQNRSMVAWSEDGTVFFGPGSFRATLLVDNTPAGIIRSINTPTPLGEVGLYTSHFGRAPQTAGVAGQAVHVKEGQINLTKTLESGPAPLMEPDSWMVFNRGRHSMAEKGNATLKIQWRDSEMTDVTTAVQGGPMLLKNRITSSYNEGFNSSFSNRRHPRTLVGYDGQRLWWIVVDGRDSRHSVGLTLGEATIRGKQWGFESLLNLDGGGSSELIYRGRIINKPSDGRERRLPYALVFNGTRPSAVPEAEEPDLIDQLIRKLLSQ